MMPNELEEFAKDIALAIRGGEPVPDHQWDGESADDKELTGECRRIAAMMAAYGYSRQEKLPVVYRTPPGDAGPLFAIYGSSSANYSDVLETKIKQLQIENIQYRDSRDLFATYNVGLKKALAEICRCTDMRAGNGNAHVFGIAHRALEMKDGRNAQPSY